MVAEEALDTEGRRRVAEVLRLQDGWSDIPLIVLTAPRPMATQGRQALEELSILGNVTTLEQPLHEATLALGLRSAIRARRRQYATRDLLAALQSALQQRDAFLAILGHELRNPLGAMRNAVRIARDIRGDQGSALAQLEVIERQAAVLQRLVNDLLDVSRVTSGKVALQTAPVDLGRLIERVVAQMGPAAQEAGLRLSLSADPGPLIVLGDEVRLEQIVNNLLGNSIKYTPAAGRIDVSTRAIGAEVAVTVADSGVGITEEALPRIFDLFAQSRTTLDRAGGGMGVGLTLVRSLATLHGGRVRAESAGRGAGSRFTVTLPLAPAQTAAPATAPAVPAAARAGLHLLLVEDNEDNRETLRMLLELSGHQVDTAATGPEGVRVALRELPQVAIIDIGLPGLDGYQVAARLRSALGPDMRLIALTGYGQPEDVHRALAAGFDAHVAKPVDIETLEELIQPLSART